jgi:hypothetical protein
MVYANKRAGSAMCMLIKGKGTEHVHDLSHGIRPTKALYVGTLLFRGQRRKEFPTLKEFTILWHSLLTLKLRRTVVHRGSWSMAVVNDSSEFQKWSDKLVWINLTDFDVKHARSVRILWEILFESLHQLLEREYEYENEVWLVVIHVIHVILGVKWRIEVELAHQI